MSPDEWFELFKPYGYADITSRYPCAARGFVLEKLVEYEIRVMLIPSHLSAPNYNDEWAARRDLLNQAQKCVELVREKGFVVASAPRIEFAGDYIHENTWALRDDPAWRAEALLTMEVLPK